MAELTSDGWRTPPPAAGWTVGHQIAHLAWTDELALLAATDPEQFAAVVASMNLPEDADAGAATLSDELLSRWRVARTRLVTALREQPAGTPLLWLGPPMGTALMTTARLMETWAHGTDIRDTLGAPLSVSARLRSVAHLGVRTRDFAFVQRGLPAPTDPFRVELTGPDGDLWTWGPSDAASGSRARHWTSACG
ncbi:maleylpyruvate isomerase family mycothiol-dependent enzyme [Citricoccus parietis]|uniref:Maleylpyruvate isomerase family mycothiol-dependent enzyme n=2 Tax=Citricoccus parietis TaxID=592307 RepID=A0ABV5G240_9MICC